MTKEFDMAEVEQVGQGKESVKVDVNNQRQANRNQRIEEYLTLKYEFRYNEIKQKPEFRTWKENERFQPVDSFFLNTLKRELYQIGISTSTGNIKEILCCDFSPKINPVKQYIKDLPKWDGIDHIKQLCSTVKVANPENWVKYFTKWMVATTANILNDAKCENHTCLVITGKQGAYKTTWLNSLYPMKALGPGYLYCGKPKIDDDRNMCQLLSEMMFINLDDTLKKINQTDENTLKTYITAPYVTYDRKFDPFKNDYPHMASFMGSVNGNDFLTDPTGSRRFLPFEAISIDINAAQKINIDNVYAQCKALIESGFRYYFTHEEVEGLSEHNQQFQHITQEEELLLHYFDRADENSPTVQYYPMALIMAELQQQSRLNISQKRLSDALKRHEYIYAQKRINGKRVWVYLVDKVIGLNSESKLNQKPI